MDSSNVHSADPELYSTLYWNPLITTDKNGEAFFSFYTNDLTGKFTCTLQGVSDQGVVFGQQSFYVKSADKPVMPGFFTMVGQMLNKLIAGIGD
jgi:hypothetical protein